MLSERKKAKTEISDCHTQCVTLESPAIAYRVTLTPPVDHASCAEENYGRFPRPTCNLQLAWSGNSQATYIVYKEFFQYIFE